MKPERLDELAWHACNEGALTNCEVKAFGVPIRNEALAFKADVAAAIRTAVREALDAAAADVECEQRSPFSETRADAFRDGRAFAAARIRRLRDDIAP